MTVIGVQLRQRNNVRIGRSQKPLSAVTCVTVREDGTNDVGMVLSLTLRGAQREVTTRLKSEGFTPAGRWETTAPGETVRRFRS